MACVDDPDTQPTNAAALVAHDRPDAQVKGADAVLANQPHVRSLRNVFPWRGSSARSSSAERPAVGAGGEAVAACGGGDAVPVSQGTQGAGSSGLLASHVACVSDGSRKQAAAVARTVDEGGRLMVVVF